MILSLGVLLGSNHPLALSIIRSILTQIYKKQRDMLKGIKYAGLNDAHSLNLLFSAARGDKSTINNNFVQSRLSHLQTC